ncbi:MAG: cupin domain-containing protein [Firmicutes bacterium]|nr:cupin domain-containing protein [Bacillota bacterium]
MRRFHRRPRRPIQHHPPIHPIPPIPPHSPHPPRRPSPSPPSGYTDHGRRPYVVDINRATVGNPNFRTTLWTGKNLQLTLMSIPVGGDIGLEIHPDNDQFLRIEQGQGIVQMGRDRNNLNFRQTVFNDFAVFVPAGTWHNITNIGNVPLRLYSIYAPPHHPPSTVHATKAIAEMMGD